MPILTIITVCYNSEKFIERCIRSVIPVLRALGEKVEYIVIDGASKDSTLHIIRSLISVNRQVNLISEPDKGIYDAMNKGIQLAKGKYVYFINSDDAVIPDGLVRMVEHLEVEKSIDCLYGDVEVVECSQLGEIKTIKTWEGDKILSNLEKGMICSHQAIICKRETLLKYGGFYTGLIIAADWDLILRMYRGGEAFIYKKECVAEFSRGGISSRKQHERERHIVRKRNGCYKYIDLEYVAAIKTEIYNFFHDNQH